MSKFFYPAGHLGSLRSILVWRPVPLLFLFIGCLATQQLEGSDTRDPISLYRELPADSVDARQALIDADAVAFQAGFDSVLVSVDINQPDWKSTLESASEDYFTITADSLLLSDLQFIFGADPEMRQEWYLAVQTDARGSMSRDTGDFEAAVEAFHTAATAYRKLGHLRREAVAWGSLGVAYWYVGDLEEVK